jgi:hypothetical protein
MEGVRWRLDVLSSVAALRQHKDEWNSYEPFHNDLLEFTRILRDQE